MSIRLRLTILYSSILAITLIGFSLVSYLIVERDSFNRQIDTLKSKADRIVADEAFQLPDIDELAYQFAGPEIFVQTT